MEEVLTRTARPWVQPTRKLTDEEIEELIETYDYDPAYDQDEEREPEPMFDRFGNPTRDTIASMYEVRNGIHPHLMTLEEFHDWMNEVRTEAVDEMNDEENCRTQQKISA
ncbi:MAG: hypothetical protein IJG37_08860 [Synergistaceae bacterium]|nr:hypothetical protein [Synergistaceae bacterium]MBQ7168338.1 hypothetical protein [Synergistaceae bacterium]